MAQTAPDRERGFKADSLYQFHGFDSVNLFNGNLNLTIPIAEFPVSADVSYSFVLRYSGNIWKDFEHCSPRPQSDLCRQTWKLVTDNGGVGWRFSFGELEGASALYGPDSGEAWQYVSPDGGEHSFYPTLHEPACSSSITENCDAVTAGVSYTRDGTYLRMKDLGSARVVEFPDGQRHRFVLDSVANRWSLQYIYGPSSALTEGEPTTNFVKFSYTAHPTESTLINWEISDSHGRTHKVLFQKGMRGGIVDAIEIAAPAGTTARYDLVYDDVTLVKPYATSTTDPQSAANALRTVELPSGEKWQFAYNDPDTGPDPTSGTLKTATLPTLGKINWTYQQYPFSTPGGESAATGVKERWLGDSKVQSTRYDVGSDGTVTVHTLAPAGAEWNAESKVVHYFNTQWGPMFGLPYSVLASNTDGTAKARRLSTETFDCDPAANTCMTVPDRRQYVKYESDYLSLGLVCHSDYPCARDGNRRVLSERTLYPNDGSRYADTDRSDFDGLGHYRKTVTGGNFTSGNLRETLTAFNTNTRNYNSSTRIGNSVGTYALTPTGGRSPGFNMLLATDSWNLNTFTTSYVKENGVTAWTDSCFDPATGFLERVRTNVLDGGGPAATDLLVVYTRDASSGYASREERFGGDRNAIDDRHIQLCAMPIPGHDQFSFRIDYTTQYGVLKSKRFVNGTTGTAVPFSSVDHAAIDRNSAFVTQSKDPAGLLTTFTYDSSRRLTNVSPPGVSATQYTYTNASGSTPAGVKALAGSGTNRAEQVWELDPFGRISVEKRLMPGGGWSGRKTTYDTAGRRASVSEQEEVGTPFNPLNVTSFTGYDAFGRVGSVTTPDSKTTVFTYTGDRLTKRVSQVALSTGDADVAVTEERDRAGRLIEVVEDADGTQATTNYTYDIGNRLAKVTMTSSQTTQTRLFNYDRRGFLTSESHPESCLTSYQYDALGNVVQKTTPVTTLTYSYDRAGRLDTLIQNGSNVKSFSYDRPNNDPDYSLGKLGSATRYNRTAELGEVAVTETYTYAGAGGRLSRKDTAVTTQGSSPETYNFFETYAYNALGDLGTLGYPGCASGCSSLIAPSRTITNTYRHGLLSDITPYTHPTTTSGITYHPNGVVAAVRHRNVGGVQGPTYQQTIANGMARPSAISVSDFCDSTNLGITSQPVSRTINSGSAAGLSVTASGATSYQWYRIDGTEAPVEVGDDTATLSIPLTESAVFFVRIGNGSCTLDSERATVTVNLCTPPDATITSTTSMTASTTGTATVPDSPGGTYQWTISGGTILSGAGTRQITFRAACSGSVGLSVTVTNGCSASDGETVSITAPKTAVSGSTTIAQGGSATITAQLTGVGPWTVTWSDSVTQSLSASATSASRTVTPTSTTTYTVTTLTDGYGCAGTSSGSAVVTVKPPAPTGLAATAVSATQVNLSWSFSGTADRFDVYRAGQKIGSSTNQTHNDTGVQGSTAYVYTVVAVKAGTSSAASAGNLATTVIFADDPVMAGATPIRALHVTQLQSAVNAVRVAAGLAPITFSSIGSTGIAAVHIEELRGALDPARSALGLTAVTYTRRPLAGGELIKADDMNETRRGVQ